jgi:predicted unusual protein kinase regulating ubiquinone biosynthesis (AarF/ABC1/UbiB family)
MLQHQSQATAVALSCSLFTHIVCDILCCAVLCPGDGALVYLDFGMMSSAPAYARFAIMAHVVHLVNR